MANDEPKVEHDEPKAEATPKPTADTKASIRANVLGLVVGPAIGGLIAIYSGHVSQVDTARMNDRRHTLELRERTYVTLSGVKITLPRAVQNRSFTELEGLVHQRAYRLSPSPEGADIANKVSARTRELMDAEVASLRELYQCLGEVRLAYSASPELDKVILRLERLELPYHSEVDTTAAQLAKVKDAEGARRVLEGPAQSDMNRRIESTIEQPIEELLTLLLKQIRS